MVAPRCVLGRVGRSAERRPFPAASVVALGLVLLLITPGGTGGTIDRLFMTGQTSSAATSPAVGNFTAAINRLVDLVALAGSGILTLVWARVALSWFSNDITKKVQAKDRARDALVGTLLFTAAVTGLFWGLAHWVLTGT